MTASTKPGGASAPAPAPAASAFKTLYRTRTCGELRPEHAGEKVILAGAVDAVPGPNLVVLRDSYGKTLVRLDAAAAKNLSEESDNAKAPALETVIMARGAVAKRAGADPKMPTGGVELVATQANVLSLAKAPLLFDFQDDAVPRAERIRHRYLYLRKPAVHDAFRFRTKLLAEMRRFLRAGDYEEVETPVLASRWRRGEDDDSFLAIRNRKEVYALPGRRPIHGTLLMAGGYDRTFEVARRFRRQAAYGPYQQPEYSVLEANIAYVDAVDLHRAEDALLGHIWRAVLGEKEAPAVREVTYDEALVRFGTPAPDTRYPLEFDDVTRIAAQSKVPEVRKLLLAGGAIRAVVVRQGVQMLKAEDLTAIGALVEQVKSCSLGSIRLVAEGKVQSTFFQSSDVPIEGFGRTTRPAYTSSEQGALDDSLTRDLIKVTGAKLGDVIVVTLAPSRAAAAEVTAAVRPALAQRLGLLGGSGKRKHALARVTHLPFFRHDAEKGWKLTGDPWTMPVLEEVEGDPNQIRGLAHLLALDGVNIAGGSIRNHSRDLQLRMFNIFGFDPKTLDERCGPLLDALRFGVPPHGRFSIGIDRVATILLGLPSIDEVIPMPKTETGEDPLTRSPWPIDNALLRGLFGL